MPQITFPVDLFVQGNFNAQGITLPASCVTNSQVAVAAGIAATKLQHRRTRMYADPATTTVASKRQTIHVVYGATGTLIAFRAGMITAAIGADTATIKLRKNGTDILSADISLTSATAAFATLAAAGFTSAGLVAGDVLEVDITPVHSSGTLGVGIFVQLILDEDPA